MINMKNLWIALALILVATGPVRAQRGYLLARSDGVFTIDAQGRVQKTLSRAAAETPRYLPTAGCSDVIFLHVSSTGATEVRQVRTTDGQETTIATLPRFRYRDFVAQGEDADITLMPAEESVMRIGREALCIHMMDRNLNMASYEASILVDLKQRKAQVLSLGCLRDDCRPGIPFVGTLSSACRVVESDSCSRVVKESKKRYPYFVQDRTLIAVTANGQKRRIASLQDGSNWGFLPWGPASRSGRWQPLFGNLDSSSDSLFRQVLLLDKQTGAIYPLPSAGEPRFGQRVPWPKPLSKKQLQAVNDPASLSTRFVASTSTLTALDLDEQLLIDGWLVTPGRPLLYLGGELAQ